MLQKPFALILAVIFVYIAAPTAFAGNFLSSLTKKNPPTIHIVLQIDGAVLTQDTDTEQKVVNRNSTYHLTHGILDFIQALNTIPGVKTSFLKSNSDQHQAEAMVANRILQRIRVRTGIKLPFRVYSENDIKVDGKLDLSKFSKSWDLEHTILISNGMTEVLPGQERNVLKLYRYDDFDTGAFTPSDLIHLIRSKMNLVRAMGLILDSFRLSELSNWPLLSSLHHLQWYGTYYRHEFSNSSPIYRRGIEFLRKVNPDLNFLELTGLPNPFNQFLPQADSKRARSYCTGDEDKYWIILPWTQLSPTCHRLN